MPFWCLDEVKGDKMLVSYKSLILRLVNVYKGRHGGKGGEDDDGATEEEEFWIEHYGFQCPDPISDFRSTGILGLAMLVGVTEE